MVARRPPLGQALGSRSPHSLCCHNNPSLRSTSALHASCKHGSCITPSGITRSRWQFVTASCVSLGRSARPAGSAHKLPQSLIWICCKFCQTIPTPCAIIRRGDLADSKCISGSCFSASHPHNTSCCSCSHPASDDGSDSSALHSYKLSSCKLLIIPSSAGSSWREGQPQMASSRSLGRWHMLSGRLCRSLQPGETQEQTAVRTNNTPHRTRQVRRGLFLPCVCQTRTNTIMHTSSVSQKRHSRYLTAGYHER
jgi:hypothetical protein